MAFVFPSLTPWACLRLAGASNGSRHSREGGIRDAMKALDDRRFALLKGASPPLRG